MFSNTVNESNLFTVYAGCLDVYSSRSSQVKLDWRNIGRLEKAFPVYHWTHDLRVTVMILANTDNVCQHKTDCHWAVCALVFRLDYSEQQCLPYGESIISRGDRVCRVNPWADTHSIFRVTPFFVCQVHFFNSKMLQSLSHNRTVTRQRIQNLKALWLVLKVFCNYVS